MDRLGLGYEAVRAINPKIVYCSVTGYGQTGPKAAVAAHDLNYMADTGVLALGADGEGRPVLPPGLIADIGGGTYPAVINILLALRQAEQTGEGRSEEHTSEIQSLMRISYAVLCLKKHNPPK